MSPQLLCPECRAAWRRWADADMATVMPAPLRIASGAAYDDTAHAVIERRRRRAEDFRALVARQCELIEQICARRHPVDETGQYSLLSGWEDAA